MSENWRGARMLQKLGINPPPINFRRPARAAADGESVLSGDTGCSSFTKSEAALLGLPVPLKSPQSLAPRLPSAAKVVAWRQGARYYSSPANKTRMFKVLKHQYGSVKQQTNKENVSPSVLKQCYDKSETLLNPAQKINATVSKIPRRRLQFEENGNQLKELQEGKATEINNNHIATDSSDEEQPLSVLKKSLKVSDGEQPLSVRNKTLKVSDGEHPLSVLKKTLKVGESETTQTAPLIKKVQDPSKVNKSTCGKKASANSDKQCISVSTKVPPPTSKPKNPSKGQKNTCGKKPSAIAQKQSTSVSTKVPPPTSKPKNLSKGQKSTCEKKPSANAQKQSISVSTKVPPPTSKPKNPSKGQKSICGEKPSANSQKQSISVSTKVPPPTSKPKNPPKVNKSTSAKKTTANAQKQCRSVSTKVPQPTSKSEVQSQKVKEASEKSESSDEEASLATLKEQLVERNTFACIDQTVPKNPSKEKSKLPFLKLKELQNVDASSSRKVIMKEGNGSKDNFVFTVPSSTPKTKPMVPMDFSKKSEQRNKTTSNDLSLLDLSVPLDFSKNSEKNDSIPTSNDMSLLDLSAIESSLDLSIKGKPSVRKTFSLSSINQDDSSTINISAASSSSTGRALRSRNLQKRPIYALTSDEEEEEILDLEGETEWRVNDPTINECKNNATQDSDISSGDSSEDEIIVTLPKKQLGKKWKNKLAPSSGMKEVSNGASNWIREDIFKPVQQPVLIPPPQEEMREPLAYFQYFFDTDLLESIVHYTNLYSTWKEGGEKCINLTKTELEQFFGVWMYMGINSLPGIRDYWASETLVNQVASTMSFNRFQRIRSHLHMYDKTQESSLPTNDRFAKVRLVLDKMKMKCNDLNQEQNYSIDETMVPYKGRFAGSLRQFIRNKPHRFGVKIFNLAGSSGIIYDFLPYAGSDTFRGIDFTPQEDAMGLGAKVVISLSRTITQPADKCVYFDNFFSSVKLVRYLKDEMQLFSTGTVRSNRIDNCPLSSDKVLKDAGRGAFDYRSNNGVQITKWMDSKIVHLVSSFAGVAPEGTAQRYDKTAKKTIGVPIPHVIQLYNSKMGGVDLNDMLVELLRSPTRARRWYLSILGYMMDLALVNSFLIYKRHAHSLNKTCVHKTLKSFKIAVSQQLRLSGPLILETGPMVKKQIKLPRCPRPAEDQRYDRYDHWPSYHLPQGRCKYCSTGKTTIICGKCNMHLCFVPTRQCFLKFHLKDMQ